MIIKYLQPIHLFWLIYKWPKYIISTVYHYLYPCTRQFSRQASQVTTKTGSISSHKISTWIIVFIRKPNQPSYHAPIAPVLLQLRQIIYGSRFGRLFVLFRVTFRCTFSSHVVYKYSIKHVLKQLNANCRIPYLSFYLLLWRLLTNDCYYLKGSILTSICSICSKCLHACFRTIYL